MSHISKGNSYRLIGSESCLIGQNSDVCSVHKNDEVRLQQKRDTPTGFANL